MKIEIEVQTRRRNDLRFFDVFILQTLLYKHDLLMPIWIDGYFGPITEEAVKQFQAQKGLVQDGIVGPITWAALTGEPVEEPTDLSKILRAILEYEEGVYYSVYDSVEGGNPTAGIGHKLTDPEVATGKYPVGATLSKEQVESWYASDIIEHTKRAKAWLGEVGFSNLDPLRQALSICMAYQIGDIYKWTGTKDHILSGEWKSVGSHIETSLWYNQTPERAKRMAQMWMSGKLLEVYTK